MTKKSTASQIIELNPKTESTENSENKTNNPSDKDPKLNIEDLLTRIGIYSVNIGSKYLSQAFEAKVAVENATVAIGNFYGALGFATLDVLAQKNSKFKRLTKFGGYLFYVGSCGYDLILGLNDFKNIWYHLGNFALDVTMAYQLGRDMGKLTQLVDRKKSDKSVIRQDLEEVVSSVRSFFKGKSNDEKEKDKSLENNTSEKKEDSKSKLKDYFSAFGKAIGQGVSYGAFAGYSFGYSAFESLKENYSAYKTKQKEKSEIKRIENEKKKKEKEEQKIKEKKDNEIKNALEKIRKANKKKMKTREDEVSLIKYGGATLEDLKNREEKGKSRYEI